MAGAIGGAIHGLAAFPPHAVEVIDAQGFALADLADSLLALRQWTIPNGGVRPPPGPRRLVFAGEAIVDVVMRVPALPRRGGDALATSSEITAGGGFNVMAAAARQRLPVLYAGGHGTGPWGDVVRAALAAEGIGLLRPPDPDLDTGFDVALIEPDAERTFVTHLGAEAVRGPETWDAVRTEPGDAVYVSGYGLVPPESGPALGDWAASLPSGVLLFVDPGPLVAQIPAAVLDPVLGPLRLAELQPPGGRPAHQHGAEWHELGGRARRSRRSGPPPARSGRRREHPRPGRRRGLLPRPACVLRRRPRAGPEGDRSRTRQARATRTPARSSRPSPTAFPRSAPPPTRTPRPPSR